jgi:hypothetical protein
MRASNVSPPQIIKQPADLALRRSLQVHVEYKFIMFNSFYKPQPSYIHPCQHASQLQCSSIAAVFTVRCAPPPFRAQHY